MILGAIVILGASNNDRGELSQMALGRIALGQAIFADLKAEGWKLLLTGGFGAHFNITDKSHAAHGIHLLQERGLSPADFLEEGLSRSTVEDALTAREIVVSRNISRLHIVTSDFHIPRAEFIFRCVFSDKALEFTGAKYIETLVPAEQERLLAHENRQLVRLRAGEETVGGWNVASR